MLMKRRREPVSSQTLARKPGYFASRLSSTSSTVAAWTSTVSAPAVNFRSGVGITTLSDMIRTPECFFESRKFRFDDLRRRQIESFKRLQSISRDCDYSQILLPDSAQLDQLLRNCDRNASRCLSENSLGFCQQLDSRKDLGVRAILCPSARLGNEGRGKVT